MCLIPSQNGIKIFLSVIGTLLNCSFLCVRGKIPAKNVKITSLKDLINPAINILVGVATALFLIQYFWNHVVLGTLQVRAHSY